jgi:PAS domain S-box-containing protein
MNKKILLIETGNTGSENLQEQLLELGYIITSLTNNNFDNVLNKFIPDRPDLVLINCNKEYDCNETHKLISVVKQQDIPLLYLSNSTDGIFTNLLKNYSLYEFLVKPCDIHSLHMAVEILLVKSKMWREIKEKEFASVMVLENINEGIIRTDNKYIIIEVNKAAEEICGINKNGVIGKKLKDVFNSRIINNSEIKYHLVNEGNVNADEQLEILFSLDKTERIIASRISAIEDENHNNLGYILVFRDLSASYKTKEHLIRIQKEYEEITENSSAIICSTDKEGRILHFNYAAEKIFGYSKEELYGLTTFDLVPPEFRKKIKLHYLRQFIERRETSYKEVPLVKKSGEVIWAGQIVNLVFEGKEITGFRVVSHDITERKYAQEKLIQKEKHLESIINTAIDAIIVVDEDGKITEWNDKSYELLGWSRKEAVGNFIYDLIVPVKYRNAHFDSLKRYSKSGLGRVINRRIEIIGSHKDGHNIPIELSIAQVEIAGQISFTAFIRDITKRIESEQAIKESEKTLRMIIDLIPDRVYLKDSEGRFLLNNKAHLESFGAKEQSDVKGKTNFDLLDRNLATIYHEQDQLIVGTHEPILNALQDEVRKTGKRHWVMVSKLPFDFGEGKKTGVIGISRDITKQKLAEDMLRESNRRHQTLTNSSPVGIYRTDINGNTTFVNPRWCEIYDLTYSEALNNRWLDALIEEDRLKIPELWNNAIKEKRGGKVDFRLRKKNGDITWVMNNVVPEVDEHNNLVGYIGTVTDITERKKYELENTMLAKALRSIGECVTITDLNNKLLFVNQSFLNTYGYTEDEVIEKNISIVNSTRNPDNIRKKIIEGTIQGGWHGEIINKKKDGTEFPISLSTNLIYNSNNEPQALIGISSDISQRKFYEAELTKLNQAVIQSPVSIIITNLNGCIEYVNPKACAVTGYSQIELIGKNPRILASGKTSRKNYEQLWDALTSGNEWHGEFCNKKKNGELYWEYASITPIKNEGKLTHYLAFKEDITERKVMEENLLVAKDKAEKANELKDAFIANISHEIRTPLNGVLGMSSIIKDSFANYITPLEERYFQGIDQASKRIIRTVDMILNFSRLKVGEFNIIPGNIDLDLMINNVFLEFNILASQKKLNLVYENEIGAIRLDTDEYCLDHIFSNILDNAIKYTHEGTICIRLYRGNKNEINVDIKDTGIGIVPEYMENLFQPYTQEEMGFTRSYEGVGLGLSIAKQFALLIDAKIYVKSEKEVGTLFTIVLKDLSTCSNKMQKDDELEIENFPLHIKQEEPEVTKNILIVEDEEINRLYLQKMLSSTYNIILAPDAETAITEMRKNKFDLILMDISLGQGMNGIDLTMLLKKNDNYKNIPIIAITGHAFSQDKERCFKAGCNDYISKPFTIIDLKQKLNKYI